MIALADPIRPRARAPLQPLYRSGTDCPACGWAAWHIGRASAECARCGTALALAPERRSADQ